MLPLHFGRRKLQWKARKGEKGLCKPRPCLCWSKETFILILAPSTAVLCYMGNVSWDLNSYFSTTDQYAETCILSVFLLFLSIITIHAIFICFMVQLRPREIGDRQCFGKGELYNLETESFHGKWQMWL